MECAAAWGSLLRDVLVPPMCTSAFTSASGHACAQINLPRSGLHDDDVENAHIQLRLSTAPRSALATENDDPETLSPSWFTVMVMVVKGRGDRRRA